MKQKKRFMQRRRNQLGDRKTQSPTHMQIHVVDVVGNIVMFPALPWVQSAGSATQRITSRRCADQRKRFPVVHTSKECTQLMTDSSDKEYFISAIYQKKKRLVL